MGGYVIDVIVVLPIHLNSFIFIECLCAFLLMIDCRVGASVNFVFYNILFFKIPINWYFLNK